MMKLLTNLSFFLITTVTLFAQNFNDAYRLSFQDITFDAKSLSLGNSNIASYGNFSSALINPAGLATIRRDIFTFSLNSFNINNDTKFLSNNFSSDKSTTSLNQLGLVIPFKNRNVSMVFAFGYNRDKIYNNKFKFNSFNNSNTSMIQDLTKFNDDLMFDLGLSYPIYNENDEYLYDETNINGSLNQRGDISEDGSMDSWFISAAGQVNKKLYIGATLNIESGDYKKNRNYFEEDIKDLYTGYLDQADSNTLDFNFFSLNDILDQKITGWDFRIGMLYTVNENFHIGANIKFPTRFTIKEKYSIYGKADFRDAYFNADYPGATHEYNISTPFEFSTGVSAKVNLVTLNAGIKYVDYSQMEFTDGFNSSDLNGLNNEIEEIFEGTLNWNIGAEVILPYPSMKLRAGFIYLPSPYVNDPSDYDRKYITAGFGLPVTRDLLLDVAYVKGWWKNFSDNYDVDVSRSYIDSKLNNFTLSFSYVIR